MEKLVAANGLDLWCETFGDPADPPILLLMGLQTSGKGWSDELCEQFAAGRYVIRYDHRDVGRSSSVDFAAHPYTLGEMADDAVELLAALGLGPAHFVGVSMGGMIAQEAALRSPERVASLTLISTTAAVPDPATGTWPHGLPAEDPAVIAVAMELASSPPTTPEEQIDGFLRMARACSGSAAEVDEEEVRAFGVRLLEHDPRLEASPNQLLAFATSRDRVQLLGQITAPTLVIHGSEDPVLHVEHGELLASGIPGARLLRLEGMGHDLPKVFHPQIVAAVLEHTAG